MTQVPDHLQRFSGVVKQEGLKTGDGRVVPVTWNYDYDTVIGHAHLDDEGNLTITITDPMMIKFMEDDRKRMLKSLSVSHTPAIPAPTIKQTDHRQPNFD